MIYLKSIFCFIVAGLLEIGGGYLVWIWVREYKSSMYGISGMILLALYGFLPTLQPAHLNRHHFHFEDTWQNLNPQSVEKYFKKPTAELSFAIR